MGTSPFSHERVYAALTAPPTPTDQRPDAPSWWEASVVVITAIAAAACAVLLYSLTPPAAMIWLLAASGWLLLILGAVWLVLTIVGWVRYRAWKLSSIAVVVVAATVVLAGMSVPFTVGFAMSKSSLAEVAEDCTAPGGDRIGVYVFEGLKAADGGCLIYVEGGVVDQVGFAYLPGGAPRLGPPAGEQEIGYAELDGDWYTFLRRF
ncbi:hypothetical protein [Rhodococcoides corynebacterioides]|uniref:hypothetical protein n=1 Tax=Rhodococcoides corynebacterioides TaxID=53972 RepID=UPI001C9A5AB4|nr:hypothetical protein [Rhodococcus corynebacterioides]MBY6352352.1 hypothetical protein [Rhodococcus corynebacterioides]